EDTLGHGTFTGAIEACDYNTPTPLGTKISGIAPGAYLMNYNVFPAGAPQTDDSSIVAALEAAMLDGADVANLSLGGTASDPTLDLESQEVDLATKAGLSVVVSAGNAGPTPQTIGAPAVAPSAIAVGATTNSRFVSSSALVSGAADVPAELARMRATEGSHSFSQTVGPAPMVLAGLGRVPNDDDVNPKADDFAGKDLHGKIAVIQRGTLLFETKINNAAKAGAIGVIVYDNAKETSLLTMSMNTATLPSMFISQADGTALVSYLQSHPDAQITLDPTPTTGDETPNVLSDFSSVGYAANYDIKPDLVAPGQDIYSATQTLDSTGDLYNASGFASASGTSFSAPHVTGAVALILQKHPKWTPAQVKDALVETGSSNVLVDPSSKTVPTIAQMGGGLLDVNAAISTTALATPASITFGQINIASGPVQQTQHISLSDVGGASGAWNVAVQGLHGAASGVSISAPSSVTVPSGGQVDVAIGLSAAAGAPNSDYDGYIVLTKGSESLHVPYFAHVVSGPVQEGSVLLVDASTSRVQPGPTDPPSVHKDVSQYYMNALKALGRPYTYWDEAKLGSPSFADMKRATAVIYFTGANLAGFSGSDPEALTGPLTTLDTSALHQYLNAGGRIFISGMGAPASDFYFSAVMLGAQDGGISVYDNTTNDKALKGGISPPQPSAVPDKRVDVRSNPYIFGGMKAIDFSTKGDGAGTNLAVHSRGFDGMFGVNGLSPFYGNAAPFGNAYGAAALRTTNLPLAEGGADVAIVSSDESSFKHKASFPGRAVLFAFGFEGINNNTGYATREQVMQRIFQWFADKPVATVGQASFRAGVRVQLKATLKAGAGIHAASYTWQIGSRTLNATSNPTTHVFAHAGTYRLRVQITDSVGHVAVSGWKTVRVR
ncbi:MAG TPA: S8 family serine peptidase, partial [Chloroflexota bacterium]